MMKRKKPSLHIPISLSLSPTPTVFSPASAKKQLTPEEPAPCDFIIDNMYISGNFLLYPLSLIPFNENHLNYIGYQTASNLTYLQENQFTHILNCNSDKCKINFPQDFIYCAFAVNDNPSCAICIHFYRTIEFLQTALNNEGKVLIHCSEVKHNSQ